MVCYIFLSTQSNVIICLLRLIFLSLMYARLYGIGAYIVLLVLGEYINVLYDY